jgi:hypothetical protein
MWFCVPVCSKGVSDQLYKFINANPCDSFHWFCEKCNAHAVDTLKLIGNMKEQQEQFDSRIAPWHRSWEE